MKLELKHLAPYLPFNLRLTNAPNGVTTTTLSSYNIDNMVGSQAYKPLLRPMSDLTVEMKLLKYTTPIVNLLEIEFPKFKDLIEIKNPPETDYHYMATCTIESCPKNRFTLKVGCFNSIEVLKDNNISSMFSRFEIEQKLLEWNFDVFNLIKFGVATDINTVMKLTK